MNDQCAKTSVAAHPCLDRATAAFPTLNLAQAHGDLVKLCQRVAREASRVRILDADGSCHCVLISRAELDALEEALNILADSRHVRALRASLTQFVSSIPQGAAL